MIRCAEIICHRTANSLLLLLRFTLELPIAACKWICKSGFDPQTQYMVAGQLLVREMMIAVQLVFFALETISLGFQFHEVGFVNEWEME